MPSSSDGSLRATLIALGVLAVLAVPTWLFLALRVAGGRPLLLSAPRRPVPWVGSDVLLLALVYLALELVGAWVLNRYVAKDDPWAGVYLALATTARHVLMMSVAVGYLRVARGATVSDLGLARPRFRCDVLTGLCSALALLFPVLAINFLAALVFEPREHPVETLLKSGDELSYAALTFVAVVVVPPAEELVYRLALQGWLEKPAFGPAADTGVPKGPSAWAAILGSSIVFAVMHSAAWPAPIPLFFFALVLGLLYQRTGSLWPSIMLHAALNGTSLLTWRLAQ